MPLIHSLIAAVSGVGIAIMLVSLIALRGNRWRSALGAFVVTTAAYCVYAIGQLIRADATTIGTMDLAVRISQCSLSITTVGAMEVFRYTARAPSGRVHRGIVVLGLACALYSLVSPGGILYGSLLGVESQRMPWGEVLHLPVQQPDPLAPLSAASFSLVLLRLAQLAHLRWRQGERAHGLLMATAVLAGTFTLARAFAMVYGFFMGQAYSEVAMLFVYVVAAVEAADAQRLWILERDQAMARVRESEGKLAALVGQGQTLSGILTPEGSLVLVNRRALELVGCDAKDVIGKHLAETPWWQHSSALQQRLRQAIERAASGQADRFQATHPLPGGGEADIDFSLTPYRDESGVVRWLIPEGRDITELMRFERRAREEQRTEVIGQLAGGIAHDFNNMLAGILGAAELAKLDCEQPEVRASLDIVVEAAVRAAALTRQLLLFARRGSAKTEVFGLHSVLTNTLALFQRMAGPNVVTIARLAAQRDRISGDLTLVQSAVMNLLVNAKDAMSSNGTVTVTTANATLTAAETSRFALSVEPGEYLRLAVEDTGAGIPAEVLPRIFEPFFTTKEVGKGTGLGLATVVGCIRDHRGAIEVKSKLGEGTCFTLYLPLSEHSIASALDRRTDLSFKAGGQLALVVDDEPIVRNSMERLLTRFGFAVQMAEDGIGALALLKEPQPSLALLDLHMRGMNGCELAAILRERFPTLPIVLTSGNFGAWDLSKLRADPKVRFLAKPARAEDLLEALVDLGVRQSS